MAYIIGDACISCAACASKCTVACISAGENKDIKVADKCIDCGSCADVCPVEAPSAE